MIHQFSDGTKVEYGEADIRWNDSDGDEITVRFTMDDNFDDQDKTPEHERFDDTIFWYGELKTGPGYEFEVLAVRK